MVLQGPKKGGLARGSRDIEVLGSLTIEVTRHKNTGCIEVVQATNPCIVSCRKLNKVGATMTSDEARDID
jgi:hypothetical protein